MIRLIRISLVACLVFVAGLGFVYGDGDDHCTTGNSASGCSSMMSHWTNRAYTITWVTNIFGYCESGNQSCTYCNPDMALEYGQGYSRGDGDELRLTAAGNPLRVRVLFSLGQRTSICDNCGSGSRVVTVTASGVNIRYEFRMDTNLCPGTCSWVSIVDSSDGGLRANIETDSGVSYSWSHTSENPVNSYDPFYEEWSCGEGDSCTFSGSGHFNGYLRLADDLYYYFSGWVEGGSITYTVRVTDNEDTSWATLYFEESGQRDEQALGVRWHQLRKQIGATE